MSKEAPKAAGGRKNQNVVEVSDTISHFEIL